MNVPDASLVTRYVRESAYRHKVRSSLVYGPCRKAAVCHARWEVMRRLRSEGYSLLAIGEALARDHTTVLHGLRAEAPGLWFA